ncbi:HTH domain-containing protein [Clostridium intestinale]|uniref:BglG family transcription antiterminator n=1 Tax=Clostridium intestinale TaxID=36845 RepID=UPI0028F13335|nr:HTH domain-containing protein [Clostridium intestinale]
MIRRYREILSTILNANEYITLNKLADLLSVSIRTIQLDIKEINNQLKEYDLKIDSAAKKGYYLTEKSKKILLENDIIRSIWDIEYITETPADPFERQMYILLNLIANENIEMEKLANMVYVSTSTLHNDISKLRNWLKENLKGNFINYSFSKGIKLKCGEKEKRNIISWIIGKKINISTITKYWSYLFKDRNIDKSVFEVTHIIDSEIRKFGYNMSGYSIGLFCVEVLTGVRRFQQGYRIEAENSSNEELMPVIIGLKEKIKEHFDVMLTEEECLNIQSNFKSKQFTEETEIKLLKTEESVYIIDEFFSRVDKNLNLDISSCRELKENLELYIPPMVNRLRFNHCIANPIQDSVTDFYSLEFKIAKEMADIIEEKLGLKVNCIELSYITMNLVATNDLWSKKLNCIIICDFDVSIISFFKHKVLKFVEDRVRLDKCYTYQEFIAKPKEELENIDFIITTSTIADKTDIPFVQIDTNIDYEQVIKIHKYLDTIKK